MKWDIENHFLGQENTGLFFDPKPSLNANDVTICTRRVTRVLWVAGESAKCQTGAFGSEPEESPRKSSVCQPAGDTRQDLKLNSPDKIICHPVNVPFANQLMTQRAIESTPCYTTC